MTKEEFVFDNENIYLTRLKELVIKKIKDKAYFIIIDSGEQALYNWIQRNYDSIMRYLREDNLKLSSFFISGDKKYLIEWS